MLWECTIAGAIFAAVLAVIGVGVWLNIGLLVGAGAVMLAVYILFALRLVA